jgi:hypothetical protein
VTGSMTNFRTNAYIGPVAVWPNSAPNYVSINAQGQGIIYPELVKVEVRSTHTCQIGPLPYPFITRSAFTVI